MMVYVQYLGHWCYNVNPAGKELISYVNHIKTNYDLNYIYIVCFSLH
jgi:hypothetical protein